LKGLKVLLLEAGPKLDLAADFHHHQKPYQFPFRGRIRPRERAKYNYAVNDWNRPSFVNELEHPYTGKKFVWVRARAVGGKTLHWGLVALRFSPRDFEAARYDGYGENWPITYEDVEPYYARVEKMIGVCGNPDHLENNPDSQPACDPRALGDGHGTDQRPRPLPLLRALRQGVQRRRLVQLRGRLAPHRGKDRQFDAPAERCRVESPDGQGRKGQERPVCGPHHAPA